MLFCTPRENADNVDDVLNNDKQEKARSVIPQAECNCLQLKQAHTALRLLLVLNPKAIHHVRKNAKLELKLLTITIFKKKN